MSSIKAKPFDPTLKISRTEFLGYPNLITSSDLNRQVEGSTWRNNQTEGIVGLESDFDLNTMSVSTGSLTVSFKYTYLYCRGCKFSPSVASSFTITGLTVPTTDAEDYNIYVHLVASTKTVTFNDGNMSISGAEFEDGTKLAAANQIVYYDEKIVVSLNSAETNSIGLLGIFAVRYSLSPDLPFYPNNTKGLPFAVKQQSFEVNMTKNVTTLIESIDPMVDTKIANAVSDRAKVLWNGGITPQTSTINKRTGSINITGVTITNTGIINLTLGQTLDSSKCVVITSTGATATHIFAHFSSGTIIVYIYELGTWTPITTAFNLTILQVVP